MPNPASTGLPNPASYSSNSGYVLDNVTSLWWQQPTDGDSSLGSNCAGGCTQPDAVAYCAHLTLAGHSDWRLPTRIELISIVDTTTANPSINGTAFPGTSSTNAYWTSSPLAGGVNSYWNVFFQGGYPNQGGASDVHLVRCVR